jgi:hypothetical protein
MEVGAEAASYAVGQRSAKPTLSLNSRKRGNAGGGARGKEGGMEARRWGVFAFRGEEASKEVGRRATARQGHDLHAGRARTGGIHR